MASSLSVFLTAVVAMVLGIVIGVVGLAKMGGQLSPTAEDAVSHMQAPNVEPQVYGSR